MCLKCVCYSCVCWLYAIRILRERARGKLLSTPNNFAFRVLLASGTYLNWFQCNHNFYPNATCCIRQPLWYISLLCTTVEGLNVSMRYYDRGRCCIRTNLNISLCEYAWPKVCLFMDIRPCHRIMTCILCAFIEIVIA